MGSAKEAPIRFRGSPRNIEGLAHLTPQQTLAASVWIDLDIPEAERKGLALQTEAISPSVARLRFSLPGSVPPGVYQGKVNIRDESRPITVEVEPNPVLVAAPGQLSLQVAPGTQATVNLTLINTGNVSCEITKVYAFGLFDVAGVERAIGAAFRSNDAKGQGRLDRLMDEAAVSHGGLVRVAIQEGAGLLAPGELGELVAVLRFSGELQSGRTYSGTWPIYNLKYPVRVYVLSSPPDDDKRSRRQKESA